MQMPSGGGAGGLGGGGGSGAGAGRGSGACGGGAEGGLGAVRAAGFEEQPPEPSNNTNPQMTARDIKPEPKEGAHRKARSAGTSSAGLAAPRTAVPTRPDGRPTDPGSGHVQERSCDRSATQERRLAARFSQDASPIERRVVRKGRRVPHSELAGVVLTSRSPEYDGCNRLGAEIPVVGCPVEVPRRLSGTRGDSMARRLGERSGILPGVIDKVRAVPAAYQVWVSSECSLGGSR